ncbi:MAG: class I SAM-dependent methyltransferase [Halobacteriales archaeon]|nr:class I SAM-dependent methyltransferase [Halobacteriales archaeon]
MNPDVVLQRWFERSGEYSPRYYAHYGPDDTSKSIRQTLTATLGGEAAILELGCSSGRHLAHLFDHGYRDLHGIDINTDAFAVMEETYPELAEVGSFYCDAIENVLAEFDDGQFDAVYSVETLQHIHEDNAWVFEEVARVTDDVLITAEIEGPQETDPATEESVNYVDDDVPLYYRNWRTVFTEYGLTQTDRQCIGRETIRVFRRESSLNGD